MEDNSAKVPLPSEVQPNIASFLPFVCPFVHMGLEISQRHQHLGVLETELIPFF